MKKSKLLMLVLLKFDNWENDQVWHLCNRISDAAARTDMPLNNRIVANELREWISSSLKSYATVDCWVHAKCKSSRKFAFDSKEMMAYRKLWLIDMIAYLKSKGE